MPEEEALDPQQKQLQQSVEEFSRQLDELDAKRFALLKKVIGRIEQEKLREVIESLK